MSEFQFKYRLYEPGDEHGICRLFGEVFGKPMSLEQWRWKYRRSPFGEALNLVALNSEGEIIGHYGCQPLPFQCRGIAYKAGQLTDGMLKKEYRGKGLFLELCRKLFQACDETGFRLLFVFPTERMFHVVSLAGFFPVDEIHPFEKTLASGVCRTSYFDRFLFRIEEIKAEGFPTEELWTDFKSSCPCSLDRTQGYLRWRYDLHPHYRYLKIAVYRRPWGRTPVSFWIARIEGNKAYLLEGFCRSPQDPEDCDPNPLESFLTGLGISHVSAVVPLWHPMSRMFRKGGYQSAFAGRLACRLGPGAPHEMIQRWYYTYGDHDDF